MPFRRYPMIEYMGLWIMPYSTRRCMKKEYIVFDNEQCHGKKLHGGSFVSESLAKKYIEGCVNEQSK